MAIRASTTWFPNTASATSSRPGRGSWATSTSASGSTPASAGAHYVPAAGDDEDAIRATLDARDAGLALTVEEEGAARTAGWR